MSARLDTTRYNMYFRWWQFVGKYYHLPRTEEERNDLFSSSTLYALDCLDAGISFNDLENAFIAWKKSDAGDVQPNAVQIIRLAKGQGQNKR